MSKYYNSKRKNNIFEPESKEPFKLSRSRLELFLECPRCFYLDRRLGIERPGGFPFSLNNAVDLLLKKEFDAHRVKGLRHPLMEKYNIEAVPFEHEDLKKWQNTKVGIQFLYKPANFIVFGGIDDIWINSNKELHIVDYKATSKTSEVTIDEDWQISYKRQMEIYQWLFKMNNFKVSDIGYFVYCNGRTDREAFDKKIEFDIKVIPYKGNSSWIEKALKDAYLCLKNNVLPEPSDDCDFCSYREEAAKME
ncbi:MAG: PD-(D/E)XK nuclease family protein [Candidatus Pacebacteria bacterium]|nr:PD-(D/E)XK nuclease family protein [Candidatus Paceibacterota bacterium]